MNQPITCCQNCRKPLTYRQVKANMVLCRRCQGAPIRGLTPVQTAQLSIRVTWGNDGVVQPGTLSLYIPDDPRSSVGQG